MPIQLSCPCGKRLQVGEENAGKSGRCPACGRVLEIPAAEPMVAGPLTPAAEEAVTAEPADGDHSAIPVAVPAVEHVSAAEDWAAPSPPTYRLYSPRQVALVAFLLGPMGGLLLMALNYRRLGKRAAAAGVIVVALLLVAALLAVILATPDSAPVFVLGVPVFLAVWVAVKVLQGGLYDAHLVRGGESGSTGAALGIGLLGLLLNLGLLFGGAIVYELICGEGLGEKIDYGNGEEVYYTGGVTHEEAARLGRVLQTTGFFNGRGAKSVQASRAGGRLVVSFVVQAWAVGDVKARQAFDFLQRAISEEFGGQPVEVRLCDENLKVLKTLP
jgi:hypothetical protein